MILEDLFFRNLKRCWLDPYLTIMETPMTEQHLEPTKKTAIESYLEAQARAQQLKEEAIKELGEKRKQYISAIEEIDQQLDEAGIDSPEATLKPRTHVIERSTMDHAEKRVARRKLSASARKRISDAQRARWDKYRRAHRVA